MMHFYENEINTLLVCTTGPPPPPTCHKVKINECNQLHMWSRFTNSQFQRSEICVFIEDLPFFKECTLQVLNGQTLSVSYYFEVLFLHDLVAI